ncbi:DUF2924 domain-containing protein [Microvirga sp. CF3062]|uniref:DUF2924 domain-containing protein n=1 Tax=Microvirga sp. CF3062 TaxID=3110182 RepID=UPI002E79A87F|nr:DUF2924 domain-containing protein [Microvirga sp. CF3062]MEE1656749.1 DUF2924 domain-containing protein [Microvirga sp. CF3062]
MKQGIIRLDGGAAGQSAAPTDRQAAKQQEVESELAVLVSVDIHELRVRWRRLFRTKAPEHLSRALLVRILSYRLQAVAYGDLDRESLRFLDRIARQHAAGSDKPVPPVAETLSLKPGTVLIREYDGVLHQATVTGDGFAWNGTSYRSLSEVARAITGTRWNGPRFFGLRDRKPNMQAEQAA